MSSDSAADLIAHRSEPAWVRRLLIAVVVAFLAVVLILPLTLVLREAFADGVHGYLQAFHDPDTWSAIRLTLIATAVAVILNTFFGLAAAWTVVRSGIRGTSVLLGLIDIPFAVSPVIAGLLLVLLYGVHGWFGGWFREHGIRIIFGIPGIILATTFVTLPFVARELIPTLQLLGTQEEDAARLLGASPWTTFWRITLPGLRWSLLYGVILCSARALGEFGAVSVVSGHIRGRTCTLPLHIEILYNDYHQVAAFSCATALCLLAVASLGAKGALRAQLTPTAAASRPEHGGT